MAGKCKEGEDLDNLTRSCTPCRILCQQPTAKPRCAVSCEVALCKAKPGHYYDRLVRRCIKCAEICGNHPAECSKHCPTPPPPVTTKSLLQPGNPSLTPGTLEPNTLLYAALAVCAALLLSSLCLASLVLLRRRKAKNSNTKPASTTNTTDQKRKCAVQAEQESGCPGSQARRTPNDFLPSSSYPTYHEPSEDSYPTETCVCVHCFPDLRGLSHDGGRPQRAPYSFYQQGILHRAHIQNGGSPWTRAGQATASPEVQPEAAVG
uniref:TNF receptor superfamily member 13B n=1 Tax=Fundulus heteroclitus TaxID=8078 RepID=A0A3Q2QTQ6_FUNHE